MRIPAQATSRPRGRLFATGAIAVATAIAACSGGASAPSPSSTVSGSPGPASVAASDVSTPSAQALPSASIPKASPTAPIIPSLGDLHLLWQKAGPTNVPTETYWPSIDPLTGDVWVASSNENAFWIFKPDGTYVTTWGTAGSGPGQFTFMTNDPHPDGVGAIAFAPDGSFYVADNGNFRVEEFDKDRHFVRQWGSFGTGDGQFVSAKGIATDGKLVFVADHPRGDLQVFDGQGKFLRSFQFPFVLFSLALNDHLIVADPLYDGLIAMDTSGNAITRSSIHYAAYGPDPSVAGFATQAAQAVQEPSGRILVALEPYDAAGGAGMIEVDAHGSVVRHWSTGGETMALSPDGTSLYVASTGPSLTGWPFFRKYALPKG
jgi:hypothetical protein